MHIIVVSDRLAKARSIEFSLRHLVLGAAGLVAGFVVLVFLISYLGVRHAAELKLPLLQSLVLSAQQAESERTQDFLRQNLNAMAVKLGEMQAQLMRLDALGERLSTVGRRPDERLPVRRDSRARRRVARRGADARSLARRLQPPARPPRPPHRDPLRPLRRARIAVARRAREAEADADRAAGDVRQLERVGLRLADRSDHRPDGGARRHRLHRREPARRSSRRRPASSSPPSFSTPTATWSRSTTAATC